MLCAVIRGPSYAAAKKAVIQAAPLVDLIEFRLDLFEERCIEKLKIVLESNSLPFIFTLRGGDMNEIRSLASLKPTYFDLDGDIPPPFFREFPDIQWMSSFHDYETTPDHLGEIFQTLSKRPSHLQKVAVQSNKGSDTLRLIQGGRGIVRVAMGPMGEMSRIVGPLFDSPITYAYLDEGQKTAPGQLSVSSLRDVYRYKSLNKQTALFGLIGSPVNKSVGVITHNYVFSTLGLNAVYVRLDVKPHELTEVLKFPFRGLSVTMPLKEKVAQFVSVDEKGSRAINTLLFKEGKILGWNTDGRGALNAIENHLPVNGKRIVLLGTGGASQAIALEARLRGGQVEMISRKDFQGPLPKKYDILVNCTPSPLPIDPNYFLQGSFVMDLTTNPKRTLFIEEALSRGCHVIFGHEMFIEQALLQFDLWFENRLDLKEVKRLLVEKIESLPLLGEEIRL